MKTENVHVKKRKWAKWRTPDVGTYITCVSTDAECFFFFCWNCVTALMRRSSLSSASYSCKIKALVQLKSLWETKTTKLNVKSQSGFRIKVYIETYQPRDEKKTTTKKTPANTVKEVTKLKESLHQFVLTQSTHTHYTNTHNFTWGF